MGRDKALVPLFGKPLIEHVLENVSGLGDEILITTNQPEQYAFLNIRTAQDKIPGAGALAGLSTALSSARGEHILLVACDLPFVQRPLLEYLIGLAASADVVVPEWEGYLEPLIAVYSRNSLEVVNQSLLRGQIRMTSLFPLVKVRTVSQSEIEEFDPEGLSFFNVNTPEDLITAEKILNQKG
jgi:molybdopterin-guanine dinucleotide biosynthesis protein A